MCNWILSTTELVFICRAITLFSFCYSFLIINLLSLLPLLLIPINIIFAISLFPRSILNSHKDVLLILNTFWLMQLRLSIIIQCCRMLWWTSETCICENRKGCYILKLIELIFRCWTVICCNLCLKINDKVIGMVEVQIREIILNLSVLSNTVTVDCLLTLALVINYSVLVIIFVNEINCNQI